MKKYILVSMALYGSIAWSANHLVLDVDKKSKIVQCRKDINKAAHHALDQQKKAQQKLNKQIITKINAKFNTISNQFYMGEITYEELPAKLGNMLTTVEMRALKKDEEIAHDEVANVYKVQVKSSQACKGIIFSHPNLKSLYESYFNDIPSEMNY